VGFAVFLFGKNMFHSCREFLALPWMLTVNLPTIKWSAFMALRLPLQTTGEKL
jgi:hypothetical protein